MANFQLVASEAGRAGFLQGASAAPRAVLHCRANDPGFVAFVAFRELSA